MRAPITIAALSLALLSPGGWTPAPTPPFDRAAGEVCDAPVHGEAVLDEVVEKSVPGGVVYKGALLVEVTNTATGASTEVDASGSAYVTTGADGAQTWYVAGPVLTGFRPGRGNLPRGLYRIDGVYVLEIAADGYKTLTMIQGSTHDVCGDIE